MDLRNILNILTEGETEVKPNLPEGNPGRVSDLVKSQARFQSRSDGSNADMTDDFEIQTLEQFLLSNGVEPEADAKEVAAKQRNKEDGTEDLEEYRKYPPYPRGYQPDYGYGDAGGPNQKTGQCKKCDGDGTVWDKSIWDTRVCQDCDGKGYFGPTYTGSKTYDSVEESEFLGKDGKEPAVKYKDSTEADLADRMFRSKGPKGPDRELADKDEGPNARELRLIKQLSGQTKIDEDELDEVLDAPTRSASNKELQDYLSRTVDKKKLKTDKYKMPYIHRSNIVNKYKKDDDKEPKDDNILATDKQVPIVDPNGQQYDLEKLAADITERPKRILSQNEKMTHGDGTETVFFNIGIPALTGLGYDETKKEFVIINTCPGAGECKTFCYALKGGYVQWSPVSLGQTRKLNFLYNDPSGFFDKLNTEIDLENNKSLVKDDPNVSLAVRWHDAGDFFSDEYLDLSYKLADMHPNVRFYAYTKRADVSGATTDRPPNFLIRFSMGANKSEEKKIDFATTLHAITVPKELFNDLLMKSGSKLIKDAEGGWQWDSPEALDQFKERMMIKYPAIKPNTLITYDEMMKQPLGTGSAFGSRNITPKWNVMVKPGDGDDAANRSDVLGVYNLEH
jgi:hypothetical protein